MSVFFSGLRITLTKQGARARRKKQRKRTKNHIGPCLSLGEKIAWRCEVERKFFLRVKKSPGDFFAKKQKFENLEIRTGRTVFVVRVKCTKIRCRGKMRQCQNRRYIYAITADTFYPGCHCSEFRFSDFRDPVIRLKQHFIVLFASITGKSGSFMVYF